MSETTGWARIGKTYRKTIDGRQYVIKKHSLWEISLCGERLAARQYLADAKRVAHCHAENRKKEGKPCNI